MSALTRARSCNEAKLAIFDLISDIEGAKSVFLSRTLTFCAGVDAPFWSCTTTVRGRAVSVSELLEAAIFAGLRIMRRHGPVVALGRPIDHRGVVDVQQTD